MNRNRRRIALLAPVASIALLAGCAGHSGSTPSSDARSGDSGSFSTAAPEFRSTIVYGLAKSVTPTPDGAKLVWDKGDWQFNVGPIRPACRPCQTYDHGDVLTNCNPALRTTEIPADAPIKLVFPGCPTAAPGGAPDIAPDPHHADRALGDAAVSLGEFTRLVNTGCGPQYPGPGVAGLWLTFDDAGRLTAITEKFES